MKDKERRDEARAAAEEYAPRPVSSFLMYGFVGVCLAGLAWAAFANFYGVDPLAYPLWIVAALPVVFAGAIALRMARARRHAAAHRREYDKRDQP